MGIKPKIRVILEDAIDRGIERGFRRAYKHTDTPSHNDMIEQIKTAVWGENHEVIEFDEVKDD